MGGFSALDYDYEWGVAVCVCLCLLFVIGEFSDLQSFIKIQFLSLLLTPMIHVKRRRV